MFIIIYLIFMNLFAFIIMFLDKNKAINHKRRISENTLITISFLGGSIGSFFGMKIFRHKTKKIKFKILVPLSILFNIYLVIIYFTR